MKFTLAILFVAVTSVSAQFAPLPGSFAVPAPRPYTPPPAVVYTVTPSPFGKADGLRISGSDGSSGTIRTAPWGAGDARIPAVITIRPAK